jgi:NAD(P)H-hydrate epimerase
VKVPAVTTDQMREVDRMMIKVYQISLIQMMENAGLQLATLARDRFLKGEPCGKSVAVYCGTGGNGGGGLAAARRLHTWGAEITILLAGAAGELDPVPAQQYQTLNALGVQAADGNDREIPAGTDLILDALLGYSLVGNPRGEYARLIHLVNSDPTPVLSLDIPSGLDPTSGEMQNPCVRADATLTLALPKTGLMEEKARKAVGELYLADISVPPVLYKNIGLAIGPIFAQDQILRLT